MKKIALLIAFGLILPLAPNRAKADAPMCVLCKLLLNGNEICHMIQCP